ITTATVAGSGASTFAFAGSASVNLITTVVDAHIDDTPTGKSVTVTGPISIKATDNSEIVSIAGSLAVGTSTAALGAAVSYNLIANAVIASIDGAHVTTQGTLDVLASSAPILVVVTIGGAGAGNYAGGGSVSLNWVRTVTDAHIGRSSNVTATG